MQFCQSSKQKAVFQARIWLDHDAIESVEVWVHELTPCIALSRGGGEWVEEHLTSCYDRSQLAERFGLGEGCWQVLCRGTLEGWENPLQEWDEQSEFEDDFEKIQVPDDWFNYNRLQDDTVNPE